MKKIFKILLVGLVITAAISGCSDSELAIDELYTEVDTTGAFIRTLESPAQLVNLSDPEKNFIAATIEVQEGQGDVSTFKEVRLYISTFNDQDQLEPTLDVDGNPLGTTLLSTFAASDFVISEQNRLPSTSFSVPTQTILDLNPTAVYTIPTFIFVCLELELADGRIFTNENVGPSVEAGSYFKAPMCYNIIFLPN